jgi:hypothetical protein
MKISSFSTSLLAAAAVALAGAAYAGGESASPAPFAYKAPLRGAPATRVGGATRSANGLVNLKLNVLAPSDTGYTVSENPTIYWYTSEPITFPVEFTVISTESIQDAAKPLLDVTRQPPIKKGFHALNLKEFGVALKPGVEYQWFVAVVRDKDQRASDIMAGGTIKRIAGSESVAVRTKVQQASPAQRAAVYAEAGIWYDAIDQLSKEIDANPGNRQLRDQRAALLEQVGLRDAAAYDRGS